MMKIFFITLASCLVMSCNSNQKEKADKSNKEIIEKKELVSDTIEGLKKAFNHKDYLTFFKLFPSSYNHFLDLYGFDDEKGGRPLYELYEDHISYFFEYEGQINQIVFVKKLYEITKNGIWEADAPTILQDNLTRFILKQPQVILRLLISKPDKEKESFWFFVFDGSSKNDLQNKEKFRSIYKKINALNHKQAEILRHEFEEMYK